MDLRRLAYFLAVVDEGSVTGAAAMSFISQPGLSQALRELEREVGTPLFERIGRRLRLTAAGTALVPHARQALRDVEDGRAAVAAVIGLERGRLDLACLPTLVDRTVPLIAAMRRDHPGVEVHLAPTVDIDDLGSLVTAGRVDVALTDGASVPPDLVSVDVGTERLLAVLPPSWEHGPGPVTPAQLARRPLVSTPPGTSSRAALDELLADIRPPVTVAVVAGQRGALLPLVLEGAGAALLPELLANRAAALGAVVRPTRPAVVRHIALVHRRGTLGPAAAAFVALARHGPFPPV